MVCIPESLEVNNFPFTQKADHIVDIRIVGQAEDIVIGKAGFLFCRVFVNTTYLLWADSHSQIVTPPSSHSLLKK